MTFGFDLVPIIKSLGYIGIFVTILLENSIPLLFFLPGDTLLLTAGFLAAQGLLDIKIVIAGSFIIAILGYMLGYYLGRQIEPRLFREDSARWFTPENLEKTRKFYGKYGDISLFIARFLPLRACVCFMAGIAHMSYAKFMFYNILSAVFWAGALPLLGYYLGTLIPIDDMKLVLILPLFVIIGGVALFVLIARRFLKPKKKA